MKSKKQLEDGVLAWVSLTLLLWTALILAFTFKYDKKVISLIPLLKNAKSGSCCNYIRALFLYRKSK